MASEPSDWSIAWLYLHFTGSIQVIEKQIIAAVKAIDERAALAREEHRRVHEVEHESVVTARESLEKWMALHNDLLRRMEAMPTRREFDQIRQMVWMAAGIPGFAAIVAIALSIAGFVRLR